MNIGLHDAEMDSMPKKSFPNYALMKISAYHKSNGDNVEWWLPLIDLNQGMDIRLVNDDVCKILAQLKWIKYIRFSCDTKAQIPYFERFIELCGKYKLPKSKVFIYTLIRKDLAEADYRIQTLHKICKSFNIYAQAERNEKKGIIPSKMQLEFAQRYVYGRSYKKEDWASYQERLHIIQKNNLN